MKIRKTLGIDLGTTNSVIALLDPTDSALITGTDSQGCAILPSVVARHDVQGRLVTGQTARELRATTPAHASSVKRFMGLGRSFALGDESLTAPEVSARILAHCRDALASVLADPRYLLDRAIITMPAYFNHNQIEDTRKAGELAGFEVAELLHEPTAAAIYYSWLANHGDASYLVYDLGGGTFDVSVIRRRFGDYEVLGVSGDPFLGGDDFDRLLASHLQDKLARSHLRRINFDLNTDPGRRNFFGLALAAERLKIELSDRPTASYRGACGVTDEAGEPVTVEASVGRDVFHGLIKDKVHRTVECCHEALARAREKCGLRLSDVDYVILVGGSSRIPLVRDTVQAAFCNERLPEHVRSPKPLLHEPDLCVAYGAALRAATHGTRYVFPVFRDVAGAGGLLEDVDLELAGEGGLDLELHWTSPVNVRETRYTLTGCVRGPGSAEVRYGGALRVRCFATGLTEEVFFDKNGGFAIDMELVADADNALEAVVCDNLGRDLVRIPACVRHRTAGKDAAADRALLGPGVLPTQLITKPLAIEVLDRTRRRVKQIVAPVGAALPGTFRCTCRTVDQAGRIVVPVFEENRVIKEMVIADLDRRLPVGSPVDVELHIDVKHAIEVRVRVREANRTERITLAAPPPPGVPTTKEIEAVQAAIEELLKDFAGSYRARVKTRLAQLLSDLKEARFYNDEPRAIQRMAELRELEQQLEADRALVLDPPWPRFAQLVHYCRQAAGEAAQATGRDRDEMLDYVRAQERRAERAYHERNQALYRECLLNLERYAGSLDDLKRSAQPGEAGLPPSQEVIEEEARREVERFRSYLSAVWKQVRSKDRKDLEERLARVAKQSQGLTPRVKDDPAGAVREARRWGAEVHKIETLLKEGRAYRDDEETTTGLLEGML